MFPKDLGGLSWERSGCGCISRGFSSCIVGCAGSEVTGAGADLCCSTGPSACISAGVDCDGVGVLSE